MMIQVIENCCSAFYLDMLKHTATNSSNWNMKYPIGMEFEDKHLKLNIIENEPIDELLAGMAMGAYRSSARENREIYTRKLSALCLNILLLTEKVMTKLPFVLKMEDLKT